MRNILVTGGAGFIGSHLTEALLRKGYFVTVIDDLSTGSAANLGAVSDDANLTIVYDTIFNRQRIAELVDEADWIIHFAALVGVKRVVERPLETIRTNVQGTELILELASKKQKPVLIASTSEVYGKLAKVPFSEDDDLMIGATTKHRWSYACSKTIDEFLALAYHKEANLPVIIVRFFNTVGPRQTGRYGMVVPNFIQQAIAGDAITVYGDGQQARTFTHVYDVVSALTRLLDCPEAIGQVINIGGGEETTILDLAKRIKHRLNSRSPIVMIPYEQVYEDGFEDMPRRVPDIRKVNRLVGYEPQHTLDSIIRDVANYYHASSSFAPAPSLIAEAMAESPYKIPLKTPG